MAAQNRKTADAEDAVVDYRHDATRRNIPTASLASQARIREVPKQRYLYDPHLPPMLRIDESGATDRLPLLLETARNRPLTNDEAHMLAEALQKHEPWLEWASKREKKWFEVDPVALHIHERVSAQAAIRIAARQDVQRDFWADPELEYHEAVQFYKHEVDWSNRLILGDSLQVMNSLAVREDLAGKVQMIYMDPPYGITYSSNFQPTVRRRTVNNRDTDLTREPEVVKAYRDTWTLGVHTYLSYLRDRLIVARELLSDTGSIFVQIGDENVHLVRSVLDSVFGRGNFIAQISYRVFGVRGADFLDDVTDNILWFARDRDQAKCSRLFLINEANGGTNEFESVRLYRPDYTPGLHFEYEYEGQKYVPPMTMHWATSNDGLNRLKNADRLIGYRADVRFKRFHQDFPAKVMTTSWNDTWGEQSKVYAVQTSTKVVQRCMLMATDPGDLVLDPTCGGGTTAYVAEHWGRRWITIDTSRVSIALARERILTARFDYFETVDGTQKLGSDGFKFKTIPHITMKSIAQNVALDPIFAKWEPILDEKLSALNADLAGVSENTRAALLTKLEAKGKQRGRANRVTDADERRWRLPKERWEHWEVPFDTDPDYPHDLKEALGSYRKAHREKMEEVNACIAANADQETLVDQPEVEKGITRVSGPFTVEAVHPPEESLGIDSPIGGAPQELDSFGGDDFDTDAPTNAEAFRDDMIRLLRNDELTFPGNRTVTFTHLEPLADGNTLHADGEWANGNSDEPTRVAVSFGPRHGPVTAKQVEDALFAASRRGYDELVFAGFAFDGAAQAAIQADPNPRVRVHMANIAADVSMGDLLKQTKNSRLFTVSGRPRTRIAKLDDGQYAVEVEGVDIYDPVNNTVVSANANGLAAWFLDSDYDGRTFCITQAFFPDAGAWEKLARSLKSVVDADAFAAFSGTKSLPFPRGEHGRAAVKVIDPRGNEVMSLHNLDGPSDV